MQVVGGKLTARERAVLKALEALGETIEKVERRSGREFDLGYEGEKDWGLKSGPVRFSAWLPLAAIREFTVWTSEEVAEMTDHTDMAYHGDWSGVRDSSPEAIWAIFEQHALSALGA